MKITHEQAKKNHWFIVDDQLIDNANERQLREALLFALQVIESYKCDIASYNNYIGEDVCQNIFYDNAFNSIRTLLQSPYTEDIR